MIGTLGRWMGVYIKQRYETLSNGFWGGVVVRQCCNLYAIDGGYEQRYLICD
jgi:hypothetical protein